MQCHLERWRDQTLQTYGDAHFSSATKSVGRKSWRLSVNATPAIVDADQEHQFASEISVGMKARIPTLDELNGLHEGDFGRSETGYTRVPVIVRCRPAIAEIKLPEPFRVDVLVQQSGATCPKETEVTALIKYDGPATARLRFKRDGEPSQWIDAAAKKTGEKRSTPLGPKPVYLVEHVKTYHLDPGRHRFRVEVEDGKQSDVKTIEVDCPPFKVTSVWLTYTVENKDTCPKNVAETVTAKATRPGNAPFEIKTQGGLVVHSGTATFKRKGMAYVAEFGRDKLSLNEFESDMMALIKNQPVPTRAGSRSRSIAWRPCRAS